MALHQMSEFDFLKEYKAAEIPQLELDPKRVGLPTICYFNNESGEDRQLYELYAGSREVFICNIANHRRFRFNLSVGTIFIVKNMQGHHCSTFIIEDKLCQGVFTL